MRNNEIFCKNKIIMGKERPIDNSQMKILNQFFVLSLVSYEWFVKLKSYY